MSNGYEIYVIESGDYWYVGSTTRGAQKRRQEHYRGHGRAPLLAAKIQELGSAAFQQTVLEQDHGDPIEGEQRWYDWYLANDSRQTLNGKRPDSWDGSRRGTHHTPEARAKMSASSLGKPSPNKGKSTPAATRAKISASLRGQPSANKGVPKTPEHRAKLSAAMQGKTWSSARRAAQQAKSQI